MSSVRSNKPSVSSAFGLALVLTIAGSQLPAWAEDEAVDDPPPAAAYEPSSEPAPEAPEAMSEPAPEPVSEPAPETTPAAPDQAQDQTGETTPEEAAAPAAPRVPAANEKPLPASGPDYYTERAKKTVEEDGKADAKPHPLQAAHPDQNVIVCEGGCPSGKSAQIVFIEPRAARKPIAEGEVIPSSSDAASVPAFNPVVTCEAGCFDTMPRSYAGVPGGVAADIPMAQLSNAATSGSWVTTVTPAAVNAAGAKSASEGGSGDWMKRINKEMGQGAAAAPKLAPKAATPPESVAVAKPVADPAPAISPAPASATAASPTAVEISKAKVEPVAKVEPAAQVPAAPAAAEPVQAASAPGVPVTQAEQAQVSAPSPEVRAATTPATAVPPPSEPAVMPKVLNENAAAAPPPTETPATPDMQASDAAATTALKLEEKTSSSMVTTSSDAPAATEPKADTMTPAQPMRAKPDQSGQASPGVGKPSAEMNVFIQDAAAAGTKSVAGPIDPAPVKMAELTKPEAELPADKPAVVPAPPPTRDAVVNIESADTEMASAIAKARASLPEFWTKLEMPGAGESDFSLKVAIQGKSPAQIEHFWLTNIARKDGKITGTISNDPSTVKTVTRGQTHVVNPDKISDWLYKRNGKMVGNETMRPLLKRLPPQQAAGYREMYETP